MNSPPDAAPLLALQPSPRLPVLFVGHGSPMNAIEENAWHHTWRDLGRELLARPVRPQLILCISAHWLTRGGWGLTGMARPRTLHDFSGFPRILFEQQYPAPGAPAVARALAAQLRSPATGKPLGVDEGGDENEWGLDHGAWSVLKPMFPAADIPVVQLSMDYARPPAEHLALGRQLAPLRERGVLIVASGNVVHNLARVDWHTPGGFQWAGEFDGFIKRAILEGRRDDVQHYERAGKAASLAFTMPDHYAPLLYALGASDEHDSIRVFNEACVLGSLSMTSYIFG